MANSTFLRSGCIYGTSYCSAALQMEHSLFFGVFFFFWGGGGILHKCYFIQSGPYTWIEFAVVYADEIAQIPSNHTRVILI